MKNLLFGRASTHHHRSRSCTACVHSSSSNRSSMYVLRISLGMFYPKRFEMGSLGCRCYCCSNIWWKRLLAASLIYRWNSLRSCLGDCLCNCRGREAGCVVRTACLTVVNLHTFMYVSQVDRGNGFLSLQSIAEEIQIHPYKKSPYQKVNYQSDVVTQVH